ncbi:MAG: FAD/NAD(P)-binding protein [Caldimicrobium sp.]|nr:FAD/NAD(P)-binding protein [Caldimicrobium sp.]MCX7613151.1 FAD/NAD(P)-binding protein [Caldimicrobium sp.]MDW8183242.1 FAD/NAD(P)-binding protein [Caldimicrobium sp.]
MSVPKDPFEFKTAKVMKVIREYDYVYTLYLESKERVKPGQYHMLYAFGRGEAPITIAGKTRGGFIHTIRAVGSVTKALVKLKEGDLIFYRGPFGNSWKLKEAFGKSLLFISGGLGLAATRFPYEEALRVGKFKKIIHLYGAKDSESLLYRYLYPLWSAKSDFRVVVEKTKGNRTLKVGLVTDLLKEAPLDENTMVFICGPEPMFKTCLEILRQKGVPDERIFLSLERHMKCSIGSCGHCMLGPYYVCKDGPIFPYSLIRVFHEEKEL